VFLSNAKRGTSRTLGFGIKEALASSYENFRRQVSELQVDAGALQRELLSKAIDAIAFNASTTLDGKHVEKMPELEFLDKLSVDDVKKLVDLVKPGGKS
jgi:hypothetical protein